MSDEKKKGSSASAMPTAMAPPGLINKEDIPQVLPILPLRNSVFFPGGVLPAGGGPSEDDRPHQRRGAR